MRNIRLKRDDFYIGGAYFICDRCGHRFRRKEMLVEWDGLRVDAGCYDVRPPNMTPPDVPAEGEPFPDLRAPQDQPDRLQDTSSISAQHVTSGQEVLPNGRLAGPGALSPREILIAPTPQGVYVVQDQITIIVGAVPPPSVNP